LAVQRVIIVCVVCTASLASRAPSGAVAPPGLRTVSADLPSWMEGRPHAAPGSGVTVAPSDSARAAFAEALLLAVDARWEESNAAAAGAGYELIAVVDGNDWYPALVELGAGGVGPTVVLNPSPSIDLLVETPHSSSEPQTGSEGGLVVDRFGARAAILEGADRCASLVTSSCDGETTACGSASAPYRASDVAHSDDTLFQVAHETLATAWPEALVVQLHGMRADPTWLVASDGSDESRPGDSGPAARVRDRMRQALGSEVLAVSCQDPADDQYPYRNLCATSNVQGRWLAGSFDACTLEASAASPRFLHLEQTFELTNLSPPGGPLLEAIVAESPDLDTFGGGGAADEARMLPEAFRGYEPGEAANRARGCQVAR
jgi:hypothetical protein